MRTRLIHDLVENRTTGAMRRLAKRRFNDHGEVSINQHEVTDILDLIINESERIESCFLETTCVSGDMFVQMIQLN